jgi:hypothetical protein
MNTRLASRRSATPSIEILEMRVAPAGLVTATFAGGVLTLTGDTANNEIAISIVGQDTYSIAGADGTTIALNGAAAVANVTLAGVLGSIKAEFGLGNDVLSLNVITTTGAVSFEGGGGNDTLNISNSIIGGPLTFLGGGDADTFDASSGIFRVGGALLADMGDGTNTFAVTAVGSFIGGLTTILGGPETDVVSFGGGSLAVPKGITAKLGAGDNFLALSTQGVRSGPINVSHGDHAGTATTNISPTGELAVTGGVTVTYGNGNSITNVNAANSLEISGALKVTALGGTDNVTISAPGQGAIKGGLNLSLGEGSNSIGISGGGVAFGSITISSGAGVDSFFAGAASLRTGAINLNFGGGNSNVVFAGTEFQAGGAVKITTGAGDDNVVFSSAESRIPAGIFFTAGDGVNALTSGGASLKSGPINVQFGEHALGTSVVSITNLLTSIKGALTVTAKSGNEVVNLTTPTFNAGTVNLSLGDGTNAVTFAGTSHRVGGVSFVGGSGADTVTLSGQEIIVGGLKAFLGGGNNTLSGAGNSLIVGGKLQVAAGSGEDTLGLSHSNQRYNAGVGLNLGDGVNQVTFTSQTFRSGGGIKLLSGNHAAGNANFHLFATTLHVAGPVSASFASGDSSVVISSQGAGRLPGVRVVGGAGFDVLSLSGSTTEFTIGAVNFNGGDGDNAAIITAVGTRVAAVKYLGGDGTDTLFVTPTLGRAGGITANFGAGAYTLQINGTGTSRVVGPVNIQAANSSQPGNIVIQNVTLAGPVTAKTGDGVDTVVVVDALFGGAFSLNTLGGADVVNIETVSGAIPTIFRGPVNLSLGAGADVLNIGNNTAAGHAEFRRLARFDGGADADTAHVSTALFANIYIAGQPQVTGFEVED